MISSKKLSKSFDVEKDKISAAWINSYGLPHEEKMKIHDEYHKKSKELEDLFNKEMKKAYNCSDNTIQFAYELEDMSDNVMSFSAIELYIIMLLNYKEEEDRRLCNGLY